jgi:hypothetical protein
MRDSYDLVNLKILRRKKRKLPHAPHEYRESLECFSLILGKEDCGCKAEGEKAMQQLERAEGAAAI